MNTDYLSYKASKVFYTDERDGMFTKQQLIEKRRLAERCAKCPYPDDCHVCPYDIIEECPEVVDEFLKLHEQEYTDSSIGKRLHLKTETVAALRSVLGLEENKKARRKVFVPEENPCDICRSKSICVAHNCTCGDRVRWEERSK